MTNNKDMRPRFRGWAPGNYDCNCFECDTHFIGDKRAIRCPHCAYGVEHIVSAAIHGKKNGESLIVSQQQPKRHSDILQAMHKAGFDHENYPDSQGFITSTGRFVDRKEAKTLARKAGQLAPATGEELPDLYSEDLW